MLKVRPLSKDDKDVWLTLWQGYLKFYKENLTDDVTQSVWQRLFDENVSMHGYVAELDGQVVGFSHAVIHDATWTAEPVCYLEDLYVDKVVRGKGAGRALIQNLLDLAKERGWNRVYWHTNEDNKNARILYDQFVKEGGYVKYAVYTDKS